MQPQTQTHHQQCSLRKPLASNIPIILHIYSFYSHYCLLSVASLACVVSVLGSSTALPRGFASPFVGSFASAGEATGSRLLPCPSCASGVAVVVITYRALSGNSSMRHTSTVMGCFGIISCSKSHPTRLQSSTTTSSQEPSNSTSNSTWLTG